MVGQLIGDGVQLRVGPLLLAHLQGKALWSLRRLASEESHQSISVWGALPPGQGCQLPVLSRTEQFKTSQGASRVLDSALKEARQMSGQPLHARLVEQIRTVIER